jgi:predicted amidophosphoribosyltransferase
MICTYCHNDNPNHAQYCSQCGKPTIINASANGMNMNVAAVWIYVAYQLIVTFFLSDSELCHYSDNYKRR